MIVRAVLSLVAILLTCELALAQEASVADTSPQKPSAEELVRKIIADEAKIEEVKSIYLRFEGKWTNTPESIAVRKSRLESQFPGREITAERFYELRPERMEEWSLLYFFPRV